MNGAKSKKSVAKANGLKSTFKLGENKYFMTSFGKGNTALEEKDVEESTITDLRNTFKAEFADNDNTTIVINGVAGSAGVQLPCNDANQLRAKSTIEKIVFGETYSDNMHIQIAYSVMNIKKLLAVYANNIIYTVNNLLKTDYNYDFLGMFPTMNDFRKGSIAYNIIKTQLINTERSGITPTNGTPRRGTYFINKDSWKANRKTALKELELLVNQEPDSGIDFWGKLSYCIIHRLGFRNYEHIKKAAESFEKIKNIGLCQYYFSDVFTDKKSEPNMEYIYESLRLLGIMRQTAFHSSEIKKTGNKNSYTLFEIDCCGEKEMKSTLDNITKKKIDALNDKFINTSSVNLNILFSAYPKADKSEIIKEYYDFSVRKVYKNMGFSVKALRETLLATEESIKNLTSKDFDSVRSKLYSLIDFVIYCHYKNNEDEAESFVSALRSLISTKEDEKSGVTYDDKKNELYIKESKRLWKSIDRTVVEHIIPDVEKCKKSENIKPLLPDIERELKESIRDIIQHSDDLSYFSKAVYCICSFLDGKEINMFLSSLIQDFENIESFKRAIEYTDNDISFSKNFDFYNHCQNIAEELSFIKSIARMNKSNIAVKQSTVKIKSFQYFESAALFGENNQETVKELFKLESGKSPQKGAHVLRNFFINNVINSNKYRYVIRFVNPSNARKIMQNEAIVSFAIKEVDDSQIIRYCNSIGIAYDAENPDLDKMRNELSKKLMKVNFETFAKVSNDRDKNIEKEQLKALIGLYLAIIYLITKSLVRINTSYSIAFSVFERDCYIMSEKSKDKEDEFSALLENVSVKNNPQNITEYFKRSGLLNKRVRNLINRNEKHFNAEVFKYFRNNVEHLSVVSALTNYAEEIKRVESYFDLYHYLMLKIISRTFVGKYIENIDSALDHQTAYKDFLYGILTPFAYNPARYLNLTSKTLFIRGYGK